MIQNENKENLDGLAELYLEEALKVLKSKYKDDNKIEEVLNEKILPILSHIIGSHKTLEDIAPLEYFTED